MVGFTVGTDAEAVLAGAEDETDIAGAGVGAVSALAKEIPANNPPTSRSDAAAPNDADFLSILRVYSESPELKARRTKRGRRGGEQPRSGSLWAIEMVLAKVMATVDIF
jgi:hypothetical protein